ncbi:MAG: type II toxin-antitoxin system RelB/DinJ family antitoxin [Bifidobacterium sp.]|nr:type II toxin-antitoxin system RelB/DinJ family antitoxin [Bifidobacterium sp.]
MSAVISVRMDDETKTAFDRVCDQMGMSVSTAVNIFAKTVVRENRIPFPVEADPFYGEANMRHLERSLRQLEDGQVSEHELLDA